MSTTLKLNQEVFYVGVEARAIGLYYGERYKVSYVSDLGAVRVKGVNGEINILLKPSQFEPAPRLQKFSRKPGSAVVHYKNGNTFHITNLCTVEVGTVGFEGYCIAITRKYEKDGLYFSQTAHVPVSMFEKIVYKPLESDILDEEVTVTFDDENISLIYPLTHSTTHLDLDR